MTAKVCANCNTINKPEASSCTNCAKGLTPAESKVVPAGKSVGQKLSQDAGTGDILPSQDRSATLPAMADEPTTVEELLASQQVEAERQAARIRQLESDLQLAQGALSSQGEQLHAENVKTRVQQLKGKVPAAVLLAAQEIWLGDKPTAQTGEGFNLSVQVETEKDGKTVLESRDLTTPSQIVDHILSKMPDASNVAHLLASAHAGLADVSAAEHEDVQTNAKRQVDEWEREAHPERFDDEGKRKA